MTIFDGTCVPIDNAMLINGGMLLLKGTALTFIELKVLFLCRLDGYLCFRYLFIFVSVFFVDDDDDDVEAVIEVIVFE